MARVRKSSDLIGSIYDAAFAPDQWDTLLPVIAGYLNSNFAALYHQDAKSGRGLDTASVLHGLTTADAEAYLTYFGPISPTYHDVKKFPQGAIYTDRLCPDYDGYLKSETYNDYFRPLKADHLMQVYPLRDEHRLTVLLFRRDRRIGDYTPADQARFRRMVPHLEKSFALRRQFAGNGDVDHAIFDVVDGLPYGAVLLDARGRIMFMNRAAREICDADDGIVAGPQGLSIRRPPDNMAFQRLVDDAIATSLGVGSDAGAGGSLWLLRPSGRRNYSLAVSPVSRRQGGFASRRPAALVLISDPERIPEPPVAALRRLFGLTAAEAGLTALLATGISLDEAAARRSIAKETARQHLKRVFAKTETGRQAELVRLLMSLPPPTDFR